MDTEALEAARVARCERCDYEGEGAEFVEDEGRVQCPACGSEEVTVVHP